MVIHMEARIMKTTQWFLGMMAAGLVAGTALAEEAGKGTEKPEPYYLVKMAGMDRTSDTVVVSEAELRDLEKTIKLEQKYFQKAVALAAKEWNAEEINKGIMFPGSMLKPRTIVSSMKYASSEKAEEKLAKLAGLDPKKGDPKNDKRRPVARKPVKKTPKPASKQEEILTRAADYVKSKIDTLIAEAPAAGAPAAPAAPAAIDAGGAQNAVKAAL